MLNEINLSKFLSRFLNITGKDLSSMTHEDVKLLFPSLKRATFELVRKNPILLITGKVVLVNDGNKIIPYYVPEMPIEELDDPCTLSIVKDKPLQIDYRKHDYQNMSVYELKCLLKRKFNSCFNQRNARKELENRGVILTKKYNRCEEKKKIIEEE